MTLEANVREKDQRRIEQFTVRAVEIWRAMGNVEDAGRACVDDVSDHFLPLPSGAAVSLTLPGLSLDTFIDWLGRRIIWWPQGIEHRRRISIVSSRLSKRKDLHRHWFDALRTAFVRCDADSECFVTVESTAAAGAVRRAAELFRMPQLKLSVSTRSEEQIEDITTWLHAQATTPVTDPSLETSAVLSAAFTRQSGESCVHDRATPDAALVCVGQRILTLRCRHGGNVHSLVHRRLADRQKPTVLVLNHEEATSPATVRELQEVGAVPWLLHGPGDEERQSKLRETNTEGFSPQSDGEISATAGPLQQPEDWLCHWTRACPGPWPDESQDDYLDALIMDCPSADHSAVAAIMRIVESKILLPSHLSRNSVSFTEVPLSQFRSSRVYRRHLRRYDFESWGIAVKRSVLETLGCRPVQYVKDEAAHDLDVEPWQLHPATDASGKIDWTSEREWRLPSAVDLGTLGREDVAVFVDTQAEARALRTVSAWAVITVPNDVDAG